MSGIAAIICTDGGRVQPGSIEAMTAAMAYRGPDGIDHWHGGHVVLGQCMMQTTADAPPQPLASADDTLRLVMDGYLSNPAELRLALEQRGACLRGHSDADLVLSAYDQWGADCARHLDGEYAFVIWDGRSGEVFCARDHMGLRPLLYHWDGRRLIIASDLAGVLAALPQAPRVNHGYMAEVIANLWYTSDETVWTGIMRLLPAHTMRLTIAGVRLAEYWTLPVEVSITYRSDHEYHEHYRAMLADCVRRASRTDRPLGFEVSGGLDSSSLFCMADRLLGQSQLLAPDIRGYTLAGPAGTRADERVYAHAVGRHLGRDVREVPLFIPGLDWFGQQAATDRDMPTYANGAMGLHLEQAMAADGCRVAINGIGGDQWLDGVPVYYQEHLRSGDVRGMVASWRDDAAAFGLAKAARMLLRGCAAGVIPPAVKHRLKALVRGPADDGISQINWVAPEMRAELALRRQRYEAGFDRAPALWAYKLRKLRFPFQQLNFDLQNRQHARCGLEFRSPMLARSFIEFSAATPECTRLRGGVTKVIHRQALAGILPESIANRRTKAEFSAAVTANRAALQDYFGAGMQLPAAAALEIPAAAQLVEKFCETKVNARTNWEVWGIYAYATVLRMHERAADQPQ